MLWTNPIWNAGKQTTHIEIGKRRNYESRTTPGLWRHKWIPIQSFLVVDDFGVDYVGKKNADHLATILKNITISLKIARAKNMLGLA